MKKQILFFLTLLIILPLNANALSGTVKITCDKTNLSLGESTTCHLTGETDGSVSSIHSVINASTGLELTDVTKSDIWEGDNDKVLDLYTAENKTGSFDIADFVIKATAIGTSEITLTETTLGDENFKEYNFTVSPYSITITDNASNDNSSSKTSSSSSSLSSSSSSSQSSSASLPSSNSSSSNKPSSSSSQSSSSSTTDSSKILYPACNNDLVYNGKSQVLVAKNSGYTITIDGETTNAKTNAGKYKVNISLKDGYRWEDETTDDITMTCKIKKAKPNLTLEVDKKNVDVGESTTITIKADVAGDLILLNSYAKFLNITDSNAKKILNIQYLKTTLDAKIEKNYTIEALKKGSIILTAGLDPYDKTNYEVLSVGALIVKSVGEETNRITPKFDVTIDKDALNVGDYSTISFSTDVPGTVSLSSSDSSILMLSSQEHTLKANSAKTAQITGYGAGNGKISIIFTPDDTDKYNQVIKEIELSVFVDGYSSNKITPIYSISLGDTTIKANQSTTLSFAASVPGRITVTVGNKKIIKSSSSSYNLSENEEKIFKLMGLKSGTTTITVEFTPTDDDKYNGFKKVYNLTVKKNGSDNNQNVEDNPPTGNLLFIIIGVFGLGAVAYSFICFKQSIIKK